MAEAFGALEKFTDHAYRAKGRAHYYSTKKEEYAHVRFDLDTGTVADQVYHRNFS
jgi:hypothetical protein